MDLYTKLTKAILTTKKKAATVARIFVEHWVANYVISFKIVTENGPQFVSKFFVAVCSTLGLNNITTIEYHSQTNGQVECISFTLILQQRHFVFEHQTDWDLYLLPLIYVYNIQVHRSIKKSPFSLTLTQATLGPTTVAPRRTNIATDDDMASTMFARMELIKSATDIR